MTDNNDKHYYINSLKPGVCFWQRGPLSVPFPCVNFKRERSIEIRNTNVFIVGISGERFCIC